MYLSQDLPSDLLPDLSKYSLAQFEADIQKIKPRVFDTYILPGFIIGYAIKSKKEMSRTARRMLFIAGIYMVYRNYSEYKKLFLELQTKLAQSQTVSKG